MTHRLVILGCCLIVGCVARPPEKQTTRIQDQEPSRFDTMPWRWADYSNRVWISVSGVGLEGRSNVLKRVSFSYSPNTGKSTDEAIAVSSFNMFTGRRAEEFLLRALFGVRDGSLSHSNLVSDGKAFHIYNFITPQGSTNTIFFDGTKYHNLF